MTGCRDAAAEHNVNRAGAGTVADLNPDSLALFSGAIPRPLATCAIAFVSDEYGPRDSVNNRTAFALNSVVYRAPFVMVPSSLIELGEMRNKNQFISRHQTDRRSTSRVSRTIRDIRITTRTHPTPAAPAIPQTAPQSPPSAPSWDMPSADSSATFPDVL